MIEGLSLIEYWNASQVSSSSSRMLRLPYTATIAAMGKSARSSANEIWGMFKNTANITESRRTATNRAKKQSWKSLILRNLFTV